MKSERERGQCWVYANQTPLAVTGFGVVGMVPAFHAVLPLAAPAWMLLVGFATGVIRVWPRSAAIYVSACVAAGPIVLCAAVVAALLEA